MAKRLYVRFDVFLVTCGIAGLSAVLYATEKKYAKNLKKMLDDVIEHSDEKIRSAEEYIDHCESIIDAQHEIIDKLSPEFYKEIERVEKQSKFKIIK